MTHDQLQEVLRLHPGSELIIRRVERDQAVIRELRTAVRAADRAVQQMVDEIAGRRVAA